MSSLRLEQATIETGHPLQNIQSSPVVNTESSLRSLKIRHNGRLHFLEHSPDTSKPHEQANERGATQREGTIWPESSTVLEAAVNEETSIRYRLTVTAQWDHCLSTLLIRSTLGASFGIIFSVLLFKRRSWPVWTGLGFGAGRAWEECDSVRDKPSFRLSTLPRG